MKVETGNNDGFDEDVISHAKERVENSIPPKVRRVNTEYIALIERGSICIFRVSIGKKPRCVRGSMVKQTQEGSLKIGFVDVYDENIEDSIRTVIQDFWTFVRDDSDGECGVVFSPVEKSENF